MIRSYRPSDLQAMREITGICFEGTSIDQNIDRMFGRLGDSSWQERKAGTIDADAQINPDGIFVYEAEAEVIGYITCRIDARSRVGWIPNLAVRPKHQGKGLGRELLQRALSYLREEGMECARIETLEQNPVGARLYPSEGFQEVARQIHYITRL